MWLRQFGDDIQDEERWRSLRRVVTLTGTSHHKLLMAADLLSSANGFKFVSSKQQTTENGTILQSPSRRNSISSQSAVGADRHATVITY